MGIKTIQERISEISEIYKKLNELGINSEVCSGIKEFKSIANSFVKDGLGCSGKIKLQEIDRLLIYILSTQSHIISSVSLKHV